jgi:GGDEF domain-containing protein
VKPESRDPFLPGPPPGRQGVRQRFFVVFALAGVIPLLMSLYLALPLVRPGILEAGLYPRAPLFFWLTLFFLAALELLALYLGLDLVRAVSALTARVSVEAALVGQEPGGPSVAVPAVPGDEIAMLGQAFATMMATTRRQDEALQAYGARIDHLEDELRTASRQLSQAELADEVTGLGSERLLRLRLGDEVTRAIRVGTPVALVRLSVDGRETPRVDGQPVEGSLARVAATFRAVCRDVDLPCRVDHSTLAVLLPRSGRKAAGAVAERARWALTEALAADGVRAAVTCGVASLPEDGLTAADLWRAAGLPEIAEAGGRVTQGPAGSPAGGAPLASW